MYLIIIADVLVGVPPDYNGLITNLLGVHDPNGEAHCAVQSWQDCEQAHLTSMRLEPHKSMCLITCHSACCAFHLAGWQC